MKRSQLLLTVLFTAGIAGVSCCSAFGQSNEFSVERLLSLAGPGELRVQLTITADEVVVNNIQSIGLTETLPQEWEYTGYYEEYYGGTDKTLEGPTADKGVFINPWDNNIDFYWIEVPEFPITLVYGLTFANYDPDQAISGMVYVYTKTEELEIPSGVTPASDIVCLLPERKMESMVYLPGQDLTVQLRIDGYCAGVVDGLLVREAWDAPVVLKSLQISYPGFGGELPTVIQPEADSQSPFEFSWVSPPVFPLVIEYTVGSPTATSGLVRITGQAVYTYYDSEIPVDYATTIIYGANLENLHPADLNQDWRIVMSEAIQYVSGWQLGIHPMNYAIRAAYLWQVGEYYMYTPGPAPLCWEPRPVCR